MSERCAALLQLQEGADRRRAAAPVHALLPDQLLRQPVSARPLAQPQGALSAVAPGAGRLSVPGQPAALPGHLHRGVPRHGGLLQVSTGQVRSATARLHVDTLRMVADVVW